MPWEGRSSRRGASRACRNQSPEGRRPVSQYRGMVAKCWHPRGLAGHETRRRGTWEVACSDWAAAARQEDTTQCTWPCHAHLCGAPALCTRNARGTAQPTSQGREGRNGRGWWAARRGAGRGDDRAAVPLCCSAGKQLTHMEGGVWRVARTDVTGKDGMLLLRRPSRDVRPLGAAASAQLILSCVASRGTARQRVTCSGHTHLRRPSTSRHHCPGTHSHSFRRTCVCPTDASPSPSRSI